MLINTLRYSCVRVRAQRRKIGEELEGAPLLTAGRFQVRSSNGKSSAGLPPHPSCNEGRCLASLGYAQQKAVLMGHTNDYFVPLLAAFSILLFSFQAVSGQWSQWVQPASWEKGFYIQLCVTVCWGNHLLPCIGWAASKVPSVLHSLLWNTSHISAFGMRLQDTWAFSDFDDGETRQGLMSVLARCNG